jgi:hypothetical protein
MGILLYGEILLFLRQYFTKKKKNMQIFFCTQANFLAGVRQRWRWVFKISGNGKKGISRGKFRLKTAFLPFSAQKS